MEFLSYLSLCLAVATVAGQSCSQGWMEYDGSCYGFSEAIMSWVDAEDVCTFQNAKLAEVETGQENDFLKNLAKSKNASSAWLGGTDIFHEGNWTWTFSQQPFTFTDWASNQPNDAAGGEDCLVLWQSLDYQWADAPCNELHNFICETSPSGVIVG